MKRVVVVLLLGVVGCVAGPTGDVLIALEAEETITAGLVAGSAEENVIDGWSVSYTLFVATVGDVHVARTPRVRCVPAQA